MDKTKPLNPAGTKLAGSTSDLITGGSDSTQVGAHQAGVILEPGTVLAQRFRITRFIAAGGMGEVYEAFDLELKDRVALKMIRSDLAQEKQLLDLFRREIQIARKVAHRNVCRIHDLFIDTSTTGSPLALVSMELLEGKTLEDVLQETGPLTPQAALPIATQICHGLSAAHSSGVIHRDLKPSNIFLSDNGRVVITDFGLARYQEDDAGLTQTGQFMGTPAYAAPEQVTGTKCTPATDIYALGVLLFRSLSGKLPFMAESAMGTATLRLHQDAPDLRSIDKSVPQNWSRTVSWCLQRAPQARPQTADEVAESLTSSSLLSRRSVFAILLAVVVLSLGLIAKLVFQGTHIERNRSSIAFLKLANVGETDDTRAAADQVMQLLANDLESGGEIRVVPRFRVEQALHDLDITPRSEYSASDFNRLYKQLNADYVVTGNYSVIPSAQGRKARVDIRLIKGNSGEQQDLVFAIASPEQQLELESDLSAKLRSRLHLETLAQSKAISVLASFPSDPEAAALYDQGLKALHTFDLGSALPLLKKAADTAPKFAMVHYDLADAYSQLGYESLARKEAETAKGLAGQLPPEKQSIINARFYESSGDWQNSVKTYSALSDQYPDTPEYWLGLANAQASSGQPQAAMNTLNSVNARLGTSDPRFALLAANIADLEGDRKLVQEQALKAVSVSEAVGANSIKAKALVLACWAENQQGMPDPATSHCQQAATIADSLGDRQTVARARNCLANILNQQNKFDEAVPLFQSAIQITTELGDQKNLAGALLNFGNVYYGKNDFAKSAEYYQRSLEASKKRGNDGEVARATANLGGVQLALGNLADAEKLYVSALSGAQKVGDSDTTARALNNIGVILHMRGDLLGALDRYKESLAIREKMGLEQGRAYVLTEIGELFTDEGKLDDAEKSLRLALSIQQKLKNDEDARITRIDLARILMLRDQLSQAQSQLQTIVNEAVSSRDSEAETNARVALASCLARQNNLAEALKQIQTASPLLPSVGDNYSKLQLQLAAVGVKLQGVERVGALRDLQTLTLTASRMGVAREQLLARILLAKDMSRTNRQTASMLLETIRNEAQAKGFNTLASAATL